MSTVDPSGTASYVDGLFGVSSTRSEARVVIIPVPWEVTTSYGGGTSHGPLAILKASTQVDLFDLELGNAYTDGFHLLEIPPSLQELNDVLKERALSVRQALEENATLPKNMQNTLDEINAGCAHMVEWVHTQAKAILSNGQIPAVLGGDHSSPQGNMRAVCEFTKGNVGILHFDAHADLRFQYQGFTYSHASIMNNVMNSSWRPKHLVQVGIRDFSAEEHQLSQKREDIRTFFDSELSDALFSGTSWAALCEQIVEELPEQIYISFDIDGLDPGYCPNTGTPVPGGLSFTQANYLIKTAVKNGRQIVGFDLNEVAPGTDDSEWDANVGARMLYKLCGWAAQSQPKR